MGIGVSYTGYDGKTQNFTTEGNPAAGSALDNLIRGTGTMGNKLSPLADMMRQARRPMTPDRRIDKAAGSVKLDEADNRPGTLKDKLDAHGSLEASTQGLRLKGDDPSKNNVLYGKKNGQSQFVTLDDIDDPTVKGATVGEPDDQNRMAATSKDEQHDGAYSVNMQSRTEAEVNEDTGEVTFWEYTKPIDVTCGRRIGEIGGETKRKICSFFLGSGDRQITYMAGRFPFSVVRSHYTDANGNVQYEYWVRCLKWIDRDKCFDKQTENDAGTIYTMLTESVSTSGIIVPVRNWFDYILLFKDEYNEEFIPNLARGVYPEGVYGHYPIRPSNRPRKLVFDSGREAVVDFFEEKDCSPNYNDISNGWTYIGCSDDFPGGKFSIYGYFFQTRESYAGSVNNGEVVWEQSAITVHMVATTTEYKDINSLVGMLSANGAVLGSDISDLSDIVCDADFENFEKTGDYLNIPNCYALVSESAKGEITNSLLVEFGKECYIDGEIAVIKDDKVVVDKEISRKW